MLTLSGRDPHCETCATLQKTPMFPVLQTWYIPVHHLSKQNRTNQYNAAAVLGSKLGKNEKWHQISSHSCCDGYTSQWEPWSEYSTTMFLIESSEEGVMALIQATQEAAPLKNRAPGKHNPRPLKWMKRGSPVVIFRCSWMGRLNTDLSFSSPVEPVKASRLSLLHSHSGWKLFLQFFSSYEVVPLQSCSQKHSLCVLFVCGFMFRVLFWLTPWNESMCKWSVFSMLLSHISVLSAGKKHEQAMEITQSAVMFTVVFTSSLYQNTEDQNTVRSMSITLMAN